MKQSVLRVLLGLAGGVGVLAALLVLVFRLVNRTNGVMISNGERRKYLLYVPPTYDPATPTPLVISIHGFAEWPAHQMEISRWNALADQYGFLVVYPCGTRFPLRWRTYGAAGSPTDPSRDVRFLEDLIDHLQQEYNIDPRRVYANGLSNGGGMSYVLACRLAERIAAIGLVAGAYLYPLDACHPARPVPAIVFHGTADPVVPYTGGPSRSFEVDFPDIPSWVAALASRHGCDPAPLEAPAQQDVRRIDYTGCGADVVFYTIDGGGHTWPGGKPLPFFLTGRTTTTIDATRLMWEFFQRHPLPE